MTASFRKRSTLGLVLVATLVACGDSKHPNEPEPGASSLTILAGAGVADTISASPPHGLVVEVRGDDGKVVSGAAVRFETSGEGRMFVSSVESQVWTHVAGAVTDSRGRAVIRVRMSENVGAGWVVISVPAYSLVDTAGFMVLPGNPVRVSLVPQDTMLTVGMGFTYRSTGVDRNGNVSTYPLSFEPVGDAITVSDAGVVNAHAPGRVRVRVRAAGLNGPLNVVDSASVWVLPTGTIAWSGLGHMTITDLLGRELNRINASGQMPSWEPGGQRFVATYDGLIIVSADKTVTSLATPGFVHAMYPDWSTDGYIYFAGETERGVRLGRVRPDGTRLESLMPDAPATMPSVSPDGRRLTYVQGEYFGPLHVLDLPTRTSTMVLSMRVQGPPRWSPEGNWIAITGPSGGLWLVRPDGTGARQVGRDGLVPGITWSPDSRWILGNRPRATLVDLTTDSMYYLPYSLPNYPAWKR